MSFLRKKNQKETFFDILDRKQCFLDLKSDILHRGQSMVFVKKSTFFSYVFFSKETQKETFIDILNKKEPFLALKSEVLKTVKKIEIFQRG